jgi:exodeoxyribonuclease VII large subunit
MLENMNQKLLSRLKVWRLMQSRKEGVDAFRILPNTALEAIARTIPQTTDGFLSIKGIKEARFKKYGAMLLAMTRDAVPEDTSEISSELIVQHSFPQYTQKSVVKENDVFDETKEIAIPGQRTLYTVSDFLGALNVLFGEMTVRIKGEVSSVDMRQTAIYFTIKDAKDGSLLSCLIFKYQYTLSGVVLIVGQEVVIEGKPQIWKPTGRLSVKADSIEVSGEGALQKAYEDLKRTLTQEGLFDETKKRALPSFPQRIALITSNQGAAIGDFMMNLGKRGFCVSLLSVNVEGKKAVLDIFEAVQFFNRTPEKYDILVIIRGGGSLESLQAFNSEILVRAVASSHIPTLAGIGHEKDVSLVALATDSMVSTPTATAKRLTEDFETALASVMRAEQKILYRFEIALREITQRNHKHLTFLQAVLQSIREQETHAQQAFLHSVEKYRARLTFAKESIIALEHTFMRVFKRALQETRQRLDASEKHLTASDPKRLLRLGYSLIVKQGKYIKSITDLHAGDIVKLHLSDGTLDVTIK